MEAAAARPGKNAHRRRLTTTWPRDALIVLLSQYLLQENEPLCGEIALDPGCALLRDHQGAQGPTALCSYSFFVSLFTALFSFAAEKRRRRPWLILVQTSAEYHTLLRGTRKLRTVVVCAEPSIRMLTRLD